MGTLRRAGGPLDELELDGAERAAGSSILAPAPVADAEAGAAEAPGDPYPHSHEDPTANRITSGGAGEAIRSSTTGPTDDEPSWRGPSGRLYSSTSFMCLRPAQQLRYSAIMTVESRFFEPFILLTILANCATMAWESPLDPPGTLKAKLINDYAEWVYLYIFTAELCVKMLAYGVIGHRGSYLRDAWCQLDFVVVALAWLPIIFPGFGNFSALRAFRALRPLRALKRVPGMPVLIQWIVDVLPRLGSVIMLCAFIRGW